VKKVALVVLLIAAFAAVASAESARVLAYPYERVWPAAVRFLRVDQKLKIVEKDADAGYVLFEIVDDGKPFQGALQLSRTKDPDRRESTRVSLKIGGRPSYVEDRLLEKLEQKLRDELGDPAPAPPPPPPLEKKGVPDAGSAQPKSFPG
jgi:hypothetical protein